MKVSGQVCCQQGQDLTGQSSQLVLSGQRRLLKGDSVMEAHKEGLEIALMRT